jgi:hypothetical protein
LPKFSLSYAVHSPELPPAKSLQELFFSSLSFRLIIFY